MQDCTFLRRCLVLNRLNTSEFMCNLYGTPYEKHIHLGSTRFISNGHKNPCWCYQQLLFTTLQQSLFPSRISMLLFLFLSCCISSLGKRAYSTILQYSQYMTTGVNLASRGNSASKKLQGQEALSLSLRCSTLRVLGDVIARTLPYAQLPTDAPTTRISIYSSQVT